MMYSTGTTLDSTGNVLFLYEFATGSAAAPPSGTAVEDRIMAGSQNAITIREVTIGGYN